MKTVKPVTLTHKNADSLLPMQEGFKICSMCQQAHLYEFFYKNRSRADGLESYCKSCAKKRNQKKRLRNKKEREALTVSFAGFPSEVVLMEVFKPIIEELLDE